MVFQSILILHFNLYFIIYQLKFKVQMYLTYIYQFKKLGKIKYNIVYGK